MRVLAIDTALQYCSVELLKDGGFESGIVDVIGKGHAERIIPNIRHAIDSAGIGLGDIDKIVVCIGPGSFTGIRIGLSVARGLALANRIPVVGVTTLEALAVQCRPQLQQLVELAETSDFLAPHRAEIECRAAAPILSLIDAGRGNVYAQCFAADGTAMTEPAQLSIEAATDLARETAAVATGPGSALLDDSIPHHNFGSITGVPSISVIARIGAARVPGLLPPSPLYIRAADAKLQTGYALPRQPEVAP